MQNFAVFFFFFFFLQHYSIKNLNCTSNICLLSPPKKIFGNLYRTKLLFVHVLCNRWNFIVVERRRRFTRALPLILSLPLTSILKSVICWFRKMDKKRINKHLKYIFRFSHLNTIFWYRYLHNLFRVIYIYVQVSPAIIVYNSYALAETLVFTTNLSNSLLLICNIKHN